MSKLVVMKFGGTSVGSTERINAVAKRVTEHQRETGDSVVIVVSAMSGETNRLVALSEEIYGTHPPKREYDQLVAAGEQVSSALLSMAIQKLGTKSVSLLAHQVGIETDEEDGQTTITNIRTELLKKHIAAGAIPVVAGFQGVSRDGDFTTLGRGGSDTSAVAVAAAVEADRCMILTDVDGVYSTSPKICPEAKFLPFLTHEEMLEMASSGAKVLQTRSVHLARKYGLDIEVCSSFNTNPGSLITREYEGMEQSIVTGITCLEDQAKITVRNLSDQPGVVAKIFDVVSESGALVDIIVQSQGTGGNAAVSFTVAQKDLDIAYNALESYNSQNGEILGLEKDSGIVKLAIVGEGMQFHSGIAAKIFGILGEQGINIDMITTSEIKISVAFAQEHAEKAIKVLHAEFIEKQ